MSTDSDSNKRNGFVSRFATDISRSEEEVRDWLNGDGQKWLAAWVVLMAVGIIWAVATSFG